MIRRALFLFLTVLLAFAGSGCGKLSVDDPDGGADAAAPDAGPVADTAHDADTVPDDPEGSDAGSDPDMEIVDPGPVPNEGWIGGPCDQTSDCEYDEAVCLDDEDHPDGQCTLACDRLCPDRDGNNSLTFCIDDGGEGICVSQCDFGLYPDGGCRDGYDCRILGRFGEPQTTQPVCVPDTTPNPDATSDCLQALDDNDIIWSPWDYSTQYADGLACTVDDPIIVTSPINGVTYRYYNQENAGTMAMACPLALALHRLGDLLADHDVTDVLHIGTFNCRKIGGSSRLSQHGYGMAIDIWGLEDADGQDYILERDWEHDTEAPQDPKAKLLYDVARGMYEEEIFNIVLTPNYNSAHDNHFHVDLTAGSSFIGYVGAERYFGSEPSKWAEHCPDG